jgi:hypothetical protein
MQNCAVTAAASGSVTAGDLPIVTVGIDTTTAGEIGAEIGLTLRIDGDGHTDGVSLRR